MKSAEYENPRNSSCIACVKTKEAASARTPSKQQRIQNTPDCTGVRTGVTLVNSESKLLVSVGLVIVGINGGVTFLSLTSSQLILRKKEWLMISWASVGPEPKRSSGSRVRSFCRMETESRGMWMG